MRLTRYEPFGVLNQLQREVNRMFDHTGGREENSALTASDWIPEVDVREEDGRFVIHADVPGVDCKDIEITLENDVLTIKGARTEEREETRNGYRHMERARGTFMRRFTLPNTADAAKVTAKSKDGVLEIVVPKEEKAQPRKITVQS
jgi:HSP20 family protein